MRPLTMPFAAPLALFVAAAGPFALAQDAEPGRAESREPVTIEEAAELLDALETAFEKEDGPALFALMDPTQEGFADYQARIHRLFKMANYFEAEYADRTLTRTEDGSLAGYARQTLRYQEAAGRRVQIRRAVVALRLERTGSGKVILTQHRYLPDHTLPDFRPFRADHYDIRATLHPKRNEIRVELTVTVRNIFVAEADRFSFVLDGFVEELSVTTPDGRSLLERPRRGSTIVADVVLPEPVVPGDSVNVRFTYRLQRPQITYDMRLQPDFVTLVRGANWIPLLDIPAEVQEPAWSYDLHVTAPRDWAVVSAGELVQTPNKNSESDARLWHWRSPWKTGEVTLVAGPLEAREIGQAAPDARPVPMEITAWLPPGQESTYAARTLLGRIAGIYGTLADLIGAPAHRRVDIVFAPVRQMHAASQLWVLDADWLQSLPPWRPEPVRRYAHQAAHAWTLQGLETIGPGAAFLREGLAETMAFRVVSEELGPEAPHRMLADHLLTFQQMPMPGIPPGLEERTPIHFLEAGRLQGSLLMRQLELQIGSPVVWEGLREFFRRHGGGSASVWDLQAALTAAAVERDPDLETTLQAFFTAYVFGTEIPDPAIESVLSERSGEGWVHRVSVRNLGTGPLHVPVELQTRDGQAEQTAVLGPSGTQTLVFQMNSELIRVVLDPSGTVYQAKRENDWYPGPPTNPDRGVGQQQVPREQLEEIYRRRKE